MRTRTGKIARLPHHIRHDLNERLECSEPGVEILQWLNGLPEVQKLLAEEFGGDPITKQNLSHWRHGGFRDWLAHEDIRSGLAGVDEITQDWKEGRKLEIVDKATSLLSARFATLLSRWDGKPGGEFEAQARALNGLCSSLLRLQKQMLQSKHDEYDFERKVKADQEADSEKTRQKLIKPWFDVFHLPILAKLFGGGTGGAKIAKYILAVENDRMHWPDAKLEFGPEDKFEEFTPQKSNPPENPVQEKKPEQNESKPLDSNEMKPELPPTRSNVVQGSPTINFPPNEKFKIFIP